MKNNKGFTLVELLAVIVILGVVLTIAVPGVSYIINQAGNEFYKNLEKSVSIAAQDYFDEYMLGNARKGKIYFTKGGEIYWIEEGSVQQASTVSYNKYIDKVADKDGNLCTAEVNYERQGTNKYKFTPYINCDKYKTGN